MTYIPTEHAPETREAEATELLCCITAVSYTHLDVYKRQVILKGRVSVMKNSRGRVLINTLKAGEAFGGSVLFLSLIHILLLKIPSELCLRRLQKYW